MKKEFKIKEIVSGYLLIEVNKEDSGEDSITAYGDLESMFQAIVGKVGGRTGKVTVT